MKKAQDFEEVCRQASLQLSQRYSSKDGVHLIDLGSTDGINWNCLLVSIELESQFHTIPDHVEVIGKNGHKYSVPILKKVSNMFRITPSF